jgi:hypothetical protein
MNKRIKLSPAWLKIIFFKLLISEEATWPKEINLVQIQRIQRRHGVIDELKLRMENVEPTVENFISKPMSFFTSSGIHDSVHRAHL